MPGVHDVLKFIRIEAKHMTAHADVDGDHISTHPYGIAPIIKYMAGWKFSAVAEYCTKKKWKLYVYKKVDDGESNAEIVWESK